MIFQKFLDVGMISVKLIEVGNDEILRRKIKGIESFLNATLSLP
jgi:hypothetical protein